jgi:Soluble lytic murein transglycosylase and related regulatory proteins (some contain LysM/invasin domains)
MSICLALLLLLIPAAAQSGENQDSGGSASDGQAKIVIKVDPRTGRLVRQVVKPRGAAEQKPASGSAIPGSRNTAPKANLSLRAPEGIEQMVEEAARAHDIDPLLVHSVIAVESNYDPFALSPKGAEGLMQLIPSTARRFGVTNSFDPRQNIEGGVKYLKYLKTLFKDDRLALAAYNAGEGAVQKYGTVPPYQETRDYVQKVGKKLGEARARRVEPVAAEPEPEHPKLEYYTDAEGRLYLRTRVREAAENTAME